MMSFDSFISISVVIPTYNRTKTIRYCIDSILKQTYPAHEILIVDDCSTDEIESLILSYQNPKVKFLPLGFKGGAQAARNLGITRAQGNWIAFQDSDDEWREDKLKKQVEALRLLDFDENVVVHTNCITYITSQKRYNDFNIPVIEGSSEDIYRKLLLQPAPLFPTILASKKALERINLLDTNIKSFQEWDTTIRLAKQCNFVHLKEPLFVYHLHEGTTISKNIYAEIKGYYTIRKKFKEEIISEFGKLYFQLDIIWITLRAIEQNFSDISQEITRDNFSNHRVWAFFFRSLNRNKSILKLLISASNKTKNILVRTKL
ncbi:glycosyltransferase family 2 protein [Pontibacter toksunensis]|uniref:Glycosyltransferase family 2 protein n=1 Tax=Pontibacter toksunensis TaxID=1332631 RepID=A0ABW6BPZ6_9BACT